MRGRGGSMYTHVSKYKNNKILKKDSYSPLAAMYISSTTMAISMDVPQKTKNRTSI
jgi:hypothetical protein